VYRLGREFASVVGFWLVRGLFWKVTRPIFFFPPLFCLITKNFKIYRLASTAASRALWKFNRICCYCRSQPSEEERHMTHPSFLMTHPSFLLSSGMRLIRCSLIIVLCCGGWNLRTKLVPPQTAEAERPAELRALVAFVFRLFFTVLLVPVVGCGCEPPTADLMTELKAGS
jgi:hypothetical protein